MIFITINSRSSFTLHPSLHSFLELKHASEAHRLVIATCRYAYESGAPAFDSRGGFNNDEDLSGYFASSPLSDAVYGSEFTDKFCEALLRMRVNTFIPSTFAFIDESHYRVAAKRGLRLGNHHIMPMGNNVFAWPKGVSYSYRLSPAPFHAAWSALADYAQNIEGREMVYSLGYRGVRDSPFWYEDTGCTTDECRGATISQAITNQSSIAMTTPYVLQHLVHLHLVFTVISCSVYRTHTSKNTQIFVSSFPTVDTCAALFALRDGNVCASSCL